MKAYLKGAAVRAMFWTIMLIGWLWHMEVCRLVRQANRRGWTVRFVGQLGDPLGVAAGVTDHRERLIVVRTGGLSKRAVAQVLRHELEHARGVRRAWAPGWLRCGGTFGTYGALAGLVSLAFETVAGSTLEVSTQTPATYDAAGYDASSMNYSLVGEITDLGGGYGREYNIVDHAPIDSAQVTSKMGGYRLAPIELTMAWDQSDSGQDILRAANLDRSIVAIRLVKQGGHKRFFTAQVSKFVENHGTVDTVVVGMVTLLPQRNIVYSPA